MSDAEKLLKGIEKAHLGARRLARITDNALLCAGQSLTAPISARGQIGLSFVGFVCDGCYTGG